MHNIQITNAYEGNLKNVSLEIPKNKLVVFTGLSGSGKSTLLVDVLFNECQRQYLEAMALEGIHKPKVDRIQGASPAIVISQTDANKNPRSTVGTATDIYTDLRMIYEKLGVTICPYCGSTISSADCKEETEKIDSDFHVYMYCSQCGKRMDKITRTFFSFNTKEGACPVCEGLGKIHRVNKAHTVDETLSLEDGAVRYWEKQYGKYQISVLYAAFRHYGIPVPANIPVNNFNELQKEILYHGIDCDLAAHTFPHIQPPKTTAAGRFEGVIPILMRRLSDKNGDIKQLGAYFHTEDCPECNGERLCTLSRNVTVNGLRLPQLSFYSLERLFQWSKDLEASLSDKDSEFIQAYILDIQTKLNRFLRVGLGYLSLDRQILTLSGGEFQRLRLAAALDCDLSGIIYILDEPTAGLHPRDTQGLVAILRRLRDLDNTVLVIEHDEDVMAAADYIVDMGPGSGKYGGSIIAKGTLDQIKGNKASVTGSWLKERHPGKHTFRQKKGTICIENADKFNLKHISAHIPAGCLTAVTGPSGSGKSTLIFQVLARGACGSTAGKVWGLEQFDRIVEVGQTPVTRMKRSNIATYSEVYSEIRAVLGKTDQARSAGLTSRHFSFNSPGGRCENCEGLGYVENNMLFFTNTKIQCPVCHGNQFHKEVLSVKYKSFSIKDILDLSIREAAELFKEHRKIMKILNLLIEVGLGYLQLGQSLTTLSGGEGQRLKLAKELIGSNLAKPSLYLMDEPTIGLHPRDIEHFLILLNRMADAGNTVIVVEHNQQLISNCDWVIQLGPEGGEKGGNIIFTGTPAEMLNLTPPL
ncbi:MAG: excinuclease ABC subunit UvrA [Eubacteriales bacterium]|nr:excinuclease ABC subunit UvrA [Eubacteriales bacterium]